MFLFIYKQYPESFAFFILKVCEMLVYKHTETIEYVKKWTTFYKKYRLCDRITQ